MKGKKTILKKVFAYLLTMALVITSVNLSGWGMIEAQAAGGTWSGSGTISDPYLIEDLADLNTLATSVNGGNDYTSKYFKLTADIGSESQPFSNTIGMVSSSSWKNFSGNFDGDFHYVYLGEGSAGLFAYIKNGSVSNVIVRGNITNSIVVNKAHYAAGIVCNLYPGTITNCGNEANIMVEANTDNAGSFVGGICGVISSYSSVKSKMINCYNNGNITVTRSASTKNLLVGGIAGRSTLDSTTVENCYNSGTISATGGLQQQLSDIIGSSGNNPIIKYCYYVNGTDVIGYRDSSYPTITACEKMTLAKMKGEASDSTSLISKLSSYGTADGASSWYRCSDGLPRLYMDHMHDFTYSLSSDKSEIVAHCNTAGCSLTDSEVTLTLSATDADYSGSAIPVTVTAQTDFPVAKTESDVVYYESDGTTLVPTTNSGASEAGKAPKLVGSYVAKLTITTADGAAEDTTASVNYSIGKVAPTVTAPTAKTLTYNGEVQSLVNVGSTSHGTLQYALTSDGTFTTDIPTGTNAGSYNVYYKIVGDSNHSDKIFDTPVSVTISKATYGGTKTATGNILAGYASSDVEVTLPEIPEHMAYGTPSFSSPITSATIEDGKVEYSANNTAVAESPYTITVPVSEKSEESANYSNYNITVTLTGFNCDHSSTTPVSEVAATCTLDGVNAHNLCSVCGSKLIDGVSKTDEELKITKLGHNWEYTASGATLTASCSRKATCGHADVTLTLAATSQNYSGSSYTGASVTPSDFATTTGSTVSAIKYEAADSDTTYPESEIPPTNVGNYIAKVTVTYNTDQNISITKAFRITEIPVTSVTFTEPLASAPVVGDAAPTEVTGLGEHYTGAITWTPADTTFGYNKTYIAKLTLTADTIYMFADDVTIPAGWIKDASSTDSVLVLTRNYGNTAKAKITSITAPIVSDEITETTTEAAQIAALPQTVAVTAEDGVTSLAITWTIKSGTTYSTASEAVNTFVWTLADADNYNANGKAITGEVTIKNPKHVHKFSDWVDDNNASTQQNGTKTRKCACGETETVEIPDTKIVVPVETKEEASESVGLGVIKTETNIDKSVPSTEINNLTIETAKTLLTEEELKEVQDNGATVRVYLDVTNIDATVTEEDKTKVNSATEKITGNSKVGMFIDVSLFKKLSTSSKSERITNTGTNEIEVEMEVPESLVVTNDKVAREYSIVRVHEGIAEILKTEFDKVTKKIKFKTGLFSTYAIVYTDATEEEKAPEEEKKPEEEKAPEEETVPEDEKQEIVPAEKYDLVLTKGLKVIPIGKAVEISWGKVKDADGYMVYAAYCGLHSKINPKKPVKTITKNTTTTYKLTKLDGKKIDQKRCVKSYVVAYKNVDGKKQVIGTSVTTHVAGAKNPKYTNTKKITLDKSSLTVKKGKTAKIKAKTVLVDKKKSVLPESHGKTLKYASSNEKIATVSASGKITGKSKGTCDVYVIGINGYTKRVKVTVK